MLNFAPSRLLTVLTRQEGQAYVTERTRYSYLGNGIGIATILGCYKIFVNTRDPAITPFLITEGYWEYWNTQFFARYIKPGWTVVEVGANLGYFTLLFADLVGPAGRVVAFEPLSLNYDLLIRSIAVNGFADRVVCRKEALSDQAGQGVLTVDPLNFGGGSILRSPEEGMISQAVTLARGDDALTGLDPVFFKIDVEGAEEAVFAGLSGLLARLPSVAIVLEFDKGRFGDWRGWISRRRDEGFRISIVDYDGWAREVDTEALEALPMIELLLER